MNEQIVYYGFTNNPDRPHGLLHGKEPTPAIKEFVGDAHDLRFLKCPAYKDVMRNVFAIPSWFTLELVVESIGLGSNIVSQDFLDNYITTHSEKKNVYAVEQSMMCIAKDDSLLMTQEPASMTDNSFTRSCGVISGTFDIGKHFRMLSCAFFVKQGVNKVNINEDDSLYYLRFHTDKKIKFVPFFMSPKFESLILNLGFQNTNSNSWKPLEYYYKLFKKKNLKKLLVEEIKKNLL